MNDQGLGSTDNACIAWICANKLPLRSQKAHMLISCW
jgi:hypothetical protein